MKKIIDWFDLLPEEIRMRALCNTSLTDLYKKSDSLHNAVHDGFYWITDKHETFGYWLDVFRKARDGQYAIKTVNP